jgi:hypothetical protein
MVSTAYYEPGAYKIQSKNANANERKKQSNNKEVVNVVAPRHHHSPLRVARVGNKSRMQD